MKNKKELYIKKRNRIRKIIKESDKKTIAVYVTIRALIIACLILQIIHMNWANAFLCLLTLILLVLPFIIEKTFWK